MKCNRCEATIPPGMVRCIECGKWCPTDTTQPDMLPTLDKVQTSEELRIDVGPYNPLWGKGITATCLTMIAGQRGIGKSTFALHLLDYLTKVRSKGSVIQQRKEGLYLTAEMTPSELKGYADRIRIKRQDRIRPIPILSGEHNLPELITKYNPVAVILDSLQAFIKRDYAMGLSLLTGLKSVAVDLKCPVIVISHINKGGDPEGLESFAHEVDVLLYFDVISRENGQLVHGIEIEKSRVGPAGVKLPLALDERGLHLVELEEETDEP